MQFFSLAFAKRLRERDRFQRIRKVWPRCSTGSCHADIFEVLTIDEVAKRGSIRSAAESLRIAELAVPLSVYCLLPRCHAIHGLIGNKHNALFRKRKTDIVSGFLAGL